MKKSTILSVCLMAALSAGAQKNVVKEAESAMKSGKPFAEVLTIVTPAFSNAETQNDANTYYVPGKAGFKQYDDNLGKRQLGMLTDEKGIVSMADALLGGYENYMKALAMDTITDAKGKVKTKFSKDIINTVGGHYSDFDRVGADYWNAKQYDKAYKSWEIFCTLADDARFAKTIPATPDTIIGNTRFNQALAAWQNNDNAAAVQSFMKARAKGYNKKAMYEYGIAVANGAKDNEALLLFATEGNKLYGAQDPMFLNQIINYYLQTNKFDEALKFLTDGIAENPGNAQYYALRGIILDNQEKYDESGADYKKALELDPKNGLALFYLGRGIARKASIMQDAYTKNDYEAYKAKTIDPMYKEAAGYLESAYEVDPNNRNEILKVLDVIYYSLNDAKGQESVNQRKMDN